jgi:hypothetical protein
LLGFVSFVRVDMDMGMGMAQWQVVVVARRMDLLEELGICRFSKYFNSTTVRLWLYDLEGKLGTLALFTV